MEHALQLIIGNEGYKDLTDGGNLSKRLAIIVALQDWPYLDLGNSPLVIEVYAHCRIRGLDLEIDLALMVEVEGQNPNLVDE